MITKTKIFALCCLAGASAYGAPVLITSLGALSANDSVSLAQLGIDQTVLGSSFSATSAGSLAITGSFANGAGSIISVVCPASPSCSWIPSGAGFNAGDSLIVTSDGVGGSTGPLTLGFSSLFGAGLEIQVDVPGTFTARIQAFNGLNPLTGVLTESSNGSGDPLFIGVLDTLPDITGITIGLSSCGGFGCNVNDFAVDTLFLKTNAVSGVPEPSSAMLLALGLLALAGWRERKRLAGMKHSLLAIAAALLVVGGLAPAAFGQVQVTSPLKQISDGKAVATLRASGPVNYASQPLTVGSLAISLYSVLAYDGNTYQGELVGRSPFARGLRTTSVNVVVIPLIVKTISGATTFTSSPTSGDTGCLGAGNTALTLTQSGPIFNAPPTPWTFNGVQVGGLQFADAHLRAEFWKLVGPGGNAFHLALPFSTAATQTLDATGQSTVNATTYGYGGTCGANAGTTNNSGALSALDINYLDPILQGYIATLGLTPDQFPFFVTYRTVITDGPANNVNNCCILGYHNTQFVTATGNPGQTYGIALFDTGDVFTGVANASVMAHEVGEWINDPGVVNPVPVYSSGQTASCAQGGQNNLEVGDPLSGIGTNHTVTMPNSFNYSLQELAYFSWFYNADHAGSLGAGTCAGLGSGCMSTNGTFKGPARPCPTGGTYPN